MQEEVENRTINLGNQHDTADCSKYHCRYSQIFAASGKGQGEKRNQGYGGSRKTVREAAAGTESGCHQCGN